jgi:hypothetical protein
MNEDIQHLNILSIFHYVVAGISALFSLFPIIHLTMGISMLAGGFFPPEAETGAPFPFWMFGLMFTLIPAAIIFFGLAFSAFIAAAGYFLAKRKNHTFCLVMAGVSCIFMPFGTVLGVFSIIVLSRPSVKEMFNVAKAVTAS